MSRPLLYNPREASTQELEETFVARWSLLEQLERGLLSDRSGQTLRHWQIIGPRGSGKSHLTELLVRRLERDHAWNTVRLPEEHYQVSSVAGLLEQILVHLLDAPSPFAEEHDERRVEELALDAIRRFARERGQPILVIVENLGILFHQQLGARRDQQRLREILIQDSPFTLVATATSWIDATTQESAPFYDFFQTVTLGDLTRDEVYEVIETRARHDHAQELLDCLTTVRARVDAIYHLSGGNPRLVMALYSVLREGVTDSLHGQLLKLLDDVSEYYQRRIQQDATPQQARILVEMALAEGPITPAEMGRRCRMSTNVVTANIKKLVDLRFVVPGARPDGRSRRYEIRERLFRIWLQMRERRSTRRQLRFLVEFFQHWYEGQFDELERDTRHLADRFWEDLGAGRVNRCSDELRTIRYMVAAAPDGHASRLSLGTLEDKIETMNRAELSAQISTLAKWYAKADQLSEREQLGWLLMKGYELLGSTEDIGHKLDELVGSGSEEPWIIAKYLDFLVEDERFEQALSTASQRGWDRTQLYWIREALAIAEARTGGTERALSLATEALRATDCRHCHRHIGRRVSRALYAAGQQEAAEQVWTYSLTKVERENTPFEARHTAFLLVCRAAPDPSRVYEMASRWATPSQPLSSSLGDAVCALTHTGGWAGAALALYDQWVLSDRTPGRGDVRHILECLGELRSPGFEQAHLNPDAVAIASRLLRSIPGSVLAEVFGEHAESIAIERPSLSRGLTAVYGELRGEGILAEDVFPWSILASVIGAEDPQKHLDALHPEVRELVLLLLPEL